MNTAAEWFQRGVARQNAGDFFEAINCYGRVIALGKKSFEVYYNLAFAQQAIGKEDESLASYVQAVRLNPNFAEAHNNIGNIFHKRGQLEDAQNSYERALAINPGLVQAHFNLGLALHGQGKLDAAVKHYRNALSIKPGYAEAHYNLGVTLHAQGKLDAAVEVYRNALSLKPDYVEAYCNLGAVLQTQGKRDAALENFRKALSIKPDDAETHHNMGIAFQEQGRLDEAIASYRRSLSSKPDFADAYSNLLFLHGYHALLDPHRFLALARGWDKACLPEQDRQVAHTRAFQRLPPTGRRLRVGYVSGDYRQHAVSYFVEQLFTHHDRARIELFLYSTHAQRDAVTERLRVLAEHWVSLMGISDAAARERIETDNIDVLIDLSGSTAHNRLGTFARRASPVQAHYLGYFASTGLTEMDYWIGDNILTPPETDSHFSECVWRLPRVWVSYDGKVDAPVPDWRPSQDDTVWLGSFNCLDKLTHATLALWAKVLRALPEGKLLLKAKELSDTSNRQRILDVMSGHGILSGRIELQDRGATPDWFAHMAYYDRLDIALDPVGGVGGGTTTCDALWMGVPVITLEGDRMASRMTASMLDAIGRTEWIAHSEAEYVDKVIALARDVGQRKALRPIQRSRMAASPLCDAHGLAMSLEKAYFEMFERWQKKQKEKPPNHQQKNVVFMGDSITKGTCFSTSEFYTAFSARAEHGLPIAYPSYSWSFYNEGVDGSCTRDWVGWVDSKVIAHNPTDVLICLGVNDSADDIFPYHVSPADFKGNLQLIINKIRSHSLVADIILINIPLIKLKKHTCERTDPYRVQYRGIIKSVAEANGCKVVDVFSEMEQVPNQAVFDNYYFSNDGIHLSDISHALIYNALLHALGGCS